MATGRTCQAASRVILAGSIRVRSCEGLGDAFCESSSRVPSGNNGAYVKAVVVSLASDWLSLKERSMQVIGSGTESMFFHRLCDCHFFHKLVQK